MVKDMRRATEPHPAFHPEFDWVEQTIEERWVYTWRTPGGMHYEGDGPRNFGDKEIGYYVSTTIAGTVLGAHRDLGRLEPPTPYGPPMTAVQSEEIRGPYISLDTPTT
ncbi:hypothetical protein ACQ3HE_06735 [Plantibacter auratus]|uniref:hypothetical protein n=1 Tax=Plantibacter auratus TaxID=272914 RepID=UPI003D354AC9